MKKLLIYYSQSVLLLLFLFIASCTKVELPAKPQPSDFTVLVENPLDSYPASGYTVDVTINAGSNGWWIVVPEDIKWCVPSQKYGSSNQTISIKVSSNTSGESREVELSINPTFGLSPVKLKISQAGL